MNVRGEDICEFSLFDKIEEIAETLRPSDGTQARGLHKLAGVEFVDELRQKRARARPADVTSAC